MEENAKSCVGSDGIDRRLVKRMDLKRKIRPFNGSREPERL